VYLDYSTSAAPYHVAQPSSVLVLGAGGGEGVLRALRHGASVVAVELDPQIVELVREDYGELSGSLYARPDVEVVVAEARELVTRDRRRFDLVEHVVVGGLGGGGPALASLSESFLYTVEAVALYLERLAPGGVLALTTWMDNPPRGPLKMAATAIAALESRGIEDPAGRLAMLRGWQTSTILIKDGAFSRAELERLRTFCRERFFDPVVYPGMDDAEANRFNRLDEPLLHRGVVALLGSERREFLDAYAFEVAPATDDRPFFHQFFRWRLLPEVLAGRGRGSLPLLEAGYIVLVVTLLQAAVLGALLVLVPLARLTRAVVPRPEARPSGARPPAAPPAGVRSLARPFTYFGALGLAFLFLEVSFLQKFVLFLHHPVYSAALVLTVFLVFAGLGSGLSERLERRFAGRAIAVAVAAIVALGLASLVALALAAPRLAAAPGTARLVAAALLIAPLAFFMGMPFPLGLARLRARRPELVPWAWAVNGCASVVSPVAATLLAVHLGFGWVMILALAAYAVAAAAARAMP
jgi:SAM-dependent methyltransferase